MEDNLMLLHIFSSKLEEEGEKRSHSIIKTFKGIARASNQSKVNGFKR